MKVPRKALGITAALAVAGMALTGCQAVSESSDKTVKLWYLDDQAGYIANLKAEFEKANPGTILEATEVPEDNYVTKINTAMLGGQAPDVVFIYDPAWMKAGSVLPLDDALEKEGVDLSFYNPIAMSECQLEGEIYCIGSLAGAQMLLYNKDMFDAAGADYPSATEPMTIDEFATLAAKLVIPNNDPAKMVYGALIGPPTSGYLSPDNYYSADGRTIEGHVDDAATIHEYEVVSKLLLDGVAMPAALSQLSPGADMLASGAVAMGITNMEFAAKAMDAAGIKWGAAPPPAEKADDAPYFFVGTDKYGVLAGGANTKGGIDFVTFLAKEGSRIRVEAGDPPLDSRFLPDWSAGDPGRADIATVLQLATPIKAFVPVPWEVEGPLEDLFFQLSTGEASSAKDGIRKLAPELQRRLDQVWKTWDSTGK